MPRYLLLLPLLLVSCQRQTLPTETLSGANTFLENQFWGDKKQGQNICTHRVLGRQQHYVYIWELCGNYQRQGGEILVTAGESQPMRLTVNDAGQVIKTESRLSSAQLPEILPPDILKRLYWLEGNGPRRSHFIQQLETEAIARWQD